MKVGQESRNIIFAKARSNFAPQKIGAGFEPPKNQIQPSFQGFTAVSKLTNKFNEFTVTAPVAFRKFVDILKDAFTSDGAKFKVNSEVFGLLDEALDGRFKKLLDEANVLTADPRFAKKFKVAGNLYRFEDKGFFRKIGKKITYPFSTLWLDLTNKALDKLQKTSKFKNAPFIQNLQGSSILKNRKEAVAADKVFDTLHGILNKSGAPILNDKGGIIKESFSVGKISSLYHKTFSNSHGNYSTEAERSFNKIATGLVSGTFAARDFYNVTRYHNDNHEAAKKEQHGRFKQELTRSSINALLIFGTMGALSKYANINKGIAVGALVATTLFSETVSRLLNGKAILPLSVEQAKKIHAKKYGNIKAAQAPGILDAIVRMPNPIEAYKKNVFSGSAFFKKPANFLNQNSEKAQNNIKTEFNGTKKDKHKPDIKGKLKNKFVAKVITAATVLFAAGFAVAFARNNSSKFKTSLDETRRSVKDFIKIVFAEYKLIDKKRFDEIIAKLREIGSAGIADEYEKTLKEEGVKRVIKNGQEFYKLSYKKGIRGITLEFLTSIANFALKIPRMGVNFYKFVTKKGVKSSGEQGDKVKRLGSDALIATYKKLNKKIDDPNFAQYVEDSVRKSLNVNTSTHSNKDLLGKFLLFNTIVPSYFFVNDFRNHALIESNGEDKEAISATTKTKIGQRVINYFSNSFFIGIFTSLFGGTFNASLTGATLVTAATELANETTIRKLIGVPLKTMSKDELAEFDKKNYYAKGFKGKYMRLISKITGKKPLGEKAKDEEKKIAMKKLQAQNQNTTKS